MVMLVPRCLEDTDNSPRQDGFHKKVTQPQFSCKAGLDLYDIKDGKALLHLIKQSMMKSSATLEQCSTEFDIIIIRQDNDLVQSECCLNLGPDDKAAQILTKVTKENAQFPKNLFGTSVSWLTKMKKDKENEIGRGLENLKNIKSVTEFLVLFHHCKPVDGMGSTTKTKQQDQKVERSIVELKDWLAPNTKTKRENAKTEDCQIKTKETWSSLTEAKTDKPEFPCLDQEWELKEDQLLPSSVEEYIYEIKTQVSELDGTLPVADLTDCGTHHICDEIIHLKELLKQTSLVADKQNELKAEQKSSSDDSNAYGNSDLLTDLTTKHDFKIKPVVISVYMQPNKPLTKIGNIRWSFLKEEKWRLATFAKYPHNAPKSAVLLAANGFAYIGSGKGHDDKVICYFCCHTKEGWCLEDDIQEIHKILSSECHMVTGNTGNNVPYHELPSSSNLFQNLVNSLKETSAISNNENKTQVNQNDIQTDSVIDHSQIQQNQRGLLLPSSTRSVADLPSNDQRSTKDGVSRPTQFGTSTYVTPLSNGQVASRQVTTTTKNVVNSFGTTSTISSTATVLLPSHEVRQAHAQISSPNNARSQKGINSSSPETTAETANSPVSQTSHTSQQNPRSSNANSQTSVNTASSVETAQLSVAQAPQTGPTNSNPSQPSSAPSTTSAVTTSTATVNPSNGSGSSSAQNSPATAAAATTPSTNQTSTPVSLGSDQRFGSSGPTYNDLGIITERPKRYEYAVITQRLETFALWPREHHLKKEDLAEAGFYYAGYGDCARCFYCGGGLRNWEDEDDVWVEHARWFPRCAFIRQVMGQAFVDKVQDLNKDHDAIPFDMVTTAMGVTRSYFQIGSKELPMIMKRDPAVRSVLDMGFKEEDVIEIAFNIRDTLSADKLFAELQKYGKVHNITGAAFDPMNAGQNPSITWEKIDQLKEKNNELRQQTLCKICMDKDVTIVFLPCGHLISCSDCASAMKDCPVCRVTVKGIVRAFWG